MTWFRWLYIPRHVCCFMVVLSPSSFIHVSCVLWDGSVISHWPVFHSIHTSHTSIIGHARSLTLTTSLPIIFCYSPMNHVQAARKVLKMVWACVWPVMRGRPLAVVEEAGGVTAMHFVNIKLSAEGLTLWVDNHIQQAWEGVKVSFAA